MKKILRLRSGQVYKLIISLIIPQLAGGLGELFYSRFGERLVSGSG